MASVRSQPSGLASECATDQPPKVKHRNASHLLSESAHAGGMSPTVSGNSAARKSAHSTASPRAHVATAPQLRTAAHAPSLPFAPAATRMRPVRSELRATSRIGEGGSGGGKGN